MVEIKKFICRTHGLITSRKGLRKHLGEHHARNGFKNLEIVKDQGTWYREEFK